MKKKIILIIISIFLIISISAGIYVNDYYRAEDVSMYMTSSENVKISQISCGYLFDGLGEKALIFYPGAKVEETAYSPLLYKLANEGVDCFLVKMPFKLAIFGANKANSIIDNYNYENWSIAGHSLGGAMAANYAYNNSEKIKNVFLLGSYSIKDLSEKNINTYFIYGSKDQILNQYNLKESKDLLKNNYEETIIEGGNHSLFGKYGHQKGDGKASISFEEQLDITVNKIIEHIH